jgi:ribosomal protein L40E
MNAIQTTSQTQQLDYLRCRSCNALLPTHAVFCGQCGMRISSDKEYNSNIPLSDQSDIPANPHITSLVQRHPTIQLPSAFDMRRQCPIVLPDSDANGLSEIARQLVWPELQQEYALLQSQHITDIADITSLIALLPTTVRQTLTQTSNMTYPSSFRAIDTPYRQENRHTDVYNLDALLYFLLTGNPSDPLGLPDLKHYRQYSPHALNAMVMQTLALEQSSEQWLPRLSHEPLGSTLARLWPTTLEPNKHLQKTNGLGAASLYVQKGPFIIQHPLITFVSTPPLLAETSVSSDLHNNGSSVGVGEETQPIEKTTDETIQLPDIQVQLARGYLSRLNTRPLHPRKKSTGAAAVDKISIHDKQDKDAAEHEKIVQPEECAISTSQALILQSASHSEMVPEVIPGKSKERALARIKNLFIDTRSRLTHQLYPTQTDANKNASFLQRLQHFILGEQKHSTMAAALIETPMRIQPTQNYAIRIQIIGRDQVTSEVPTGGLSALIDGDIVYIEVRLALYQSYAYMVQQAEVAIPASGYAAEVTVPMHPLSSGPSSRRERLQICFMDKEHNPLYEKPFVIELFVSPLVQLGHEGHNILSIPL